MVLSRLIEEGVFVVGLVEFHKGIGASRDSAKANCPRNSAGSFQKNRLLCWLECYDDSLLAGIHRSG